MNPEVEFETATSEHNVDDSCTTSDDLASDPVNSDDVVNDVFATSNVDKASSVTKEKLRDLRYFRLVTHRKRNAAGNFYYFLLN